MHKVLNVQHLSVLDLIDTAEVNKRASILPPSYDEFDNVMVVDSQSAASEAVIMSMHVKEILTFRKSFLKRLKPGMEGSRDDWERFVIIKVDAQEGMSMYPRTMPGAILLLDRHHNSLTPYRKGKITCMSCAKMGPARSSMSKPRTVTGSCARTTRPT
jgi:hypothetical protein